MGIVSDYLRELVKRQVDERGLVVWFDPEGHYRAFVQALVLPDATIAAYDGSFFELRHRIAPLLEDEQAPRLVVYVPLAEEHTGDALIALTCAGAVLRPGQHPRQRNTRLSVVARAALKGCVAEDKLPAIEKQVDAGQLTLADLDALSDDRDASLGVLKIIYGSGDAQEIALQFLSGDKRDAEVVKKRAQDELGPQLGALVGIALPANESLAEWRVRLARHILNTDFLACLHGAPPATLAGIPVAIEAKARAACIDLARLWRLRRDASESYAHYADQVEQQLGVAHVPFTLEQLRACETFAAAEEALQSGVESALLAGPLAWPLEIARGHQGSYWSAQRPEIQARWRLIATAGAVLEGADRVAQGIREADRSAGEIVAAYTRGDRPWCELDTQHREMEYRARSFDFTQRHAALEQLLFRARARYMEVASAAAETYARALEADRYRILGFPRQSEIYATRVAPALREGKTAYILVDALRFEMARELVHTLGDDYAVELAAAIGTVPTITPIGMAALMPGAQTSVQVRPMAGAKLGLEIDGTVLKDRKGRLDWIKAHAGLGPEGSLAHVYDLTLEQLLPPSAATRDRMKRADLIVVTSQEIDQICESDNILMARGALDDILTNLARAIHRLCDAGCATIVVTADHGFIFGDELGSDMKLDPPGGATLELHRRVWVGRGGAASLAYLRAPLAAFGLSDDPSLELAVPWGFGAFKVQGGARAYFHGGMSPQEMVIPVATLTPRRGDEPGGGEIGWQLALGSKKISARFASVRLGGQSRSLFDVTPPSVRVEIRHQRAVLSVPVSASYGFVEATGDVQMQFAADDRRTLLENTIALHLTQPPSGRSLVSIHLVDAATGRELKRLESVELDLAF